MNDAMQTIERFEAERKDICRGYLAAGQAESNLQKIRAIAWDDAVKHEARALVRRYQDLIEDQRTTRPAAPLVEVECLECGARYPARVAHLVDAGGMGCVRCNA